MKELTEADEFRFWHFLEKNHFLLFFQLKDYCVVPGDVVCLQPPKMSNETYAHYKEILKQWLIENEFI